jgi:antitoxin component YwqK of YwqJK toxin-antitoxin module
MKAILLRCAPLLMLSLSFNLAAERILLDQQWQPSDMPGEVMYYINQPPAEQNGVWPLQVFHLSTDKPLFIGSLNGPDLNGHDIVGDFEFFYDNGRLSRKGSSDAKANYQGLHRHYWPDGTLKGEYQYQNGRLNGEQKSYYQNGQLQRHQQWRNGSEFGLAESFHADGQLASRRTYGADGIEGLYETFHDNGKPEQKVNMLAGKYQGERLYWAKDGWLFSQEYYVDGNKHGEQRTYQAKGILRAVENYQHGKQVGLQQHFNGPGLLAEEQQYDKDGREIQRIKYDNKGKVTVQVDTQYKAGGVLTTEQHFNDAQQLSYKYQYDNSRDWSLRERFNDAGELTGREELIKYQNQGLYIGPGWGDATKRLNYVDGKMHGPYREESADGSSIVSGQYRQGIKVGKWVSKTADLTLTEQFNPQGQQEGAQTEVAADGTVIKQEYYKNAKLHGDYLQRGYDGQLQAKGRYIDGRREGAWQLQDADSQYRAEYKLWRGNYKAGHQVGHWQAFSANGHLLGLAQYDDKGRLQGKSYSFHEDGSLIESDDYVDNVRHGRSVFYYNGEPSSVYRYVHGSLVPAE